MKRFVCRNWDLSTGRLWIAHYFQGRCQVKTWFHRESARFARLVMSRSDMRGSTVLPENYFLVGWINCVQLGEWYLPASARTMSGSRPADLSSSTSLSRAATSTLWPANRVVHGTALTQCSGSPSYQIFKYF